jgi:glucokinase
MGGDACIGVDLGGSYLKAALVDPSGKVLEFRKTALQIRRGAPFAIQTLVAECRTLSESAARLGFRLRAAGLGIAGKIDSASGSVIFSPNLPQLDGHAVAAPVEAALGVPVVTGNDADAFGIGEGWAGAGKGIENWVGATLGTGTGGCLMLGGRLWRGDGLGFSGEIGHMIVQPGGSSCACGMRGCLETFASESALVRGAREIVAEGKTQTALAGLFEAKTPNARSIFECASKGDPAARGLFDRMGWALGLALANLFTALGIRHAILGGGVSGAWDLFIGPLRETLSENMSMLPAAQAVVLKSALGESAAPVGAARMAFLWAGEAVRR